MDMLCISVPTRDSASGAIAGRIKHCCKQMTESFPDIRPPHLDVELCAVDLLTLPVRLGDFGRAQLS